MREGTELRIRALEEASNPSSERSVLWEELTEDQLPPAGGNLFHIVDGASVDACLAKGLIPGGHSGALAPQEPW